MRLTMDQRLLLSLHSADNIRERTVLSQPVNGRLPSAFISGRNTCSVRCTTRIKGLIFVQTSKTQKAEEVVSSINENTSRLRMPGVSRIGLGANFFSLFPKRRFLVLSGYLLAILMTFLLLAVSKWASILVGEANGPVLMYRRRLEMLRHIEDSTVKRKIILFWNKPVNGNFNVTFDKKSFRSCAIKSCIPTTDRSLLNVSDAVVFHMPDIIAKDMPPYRLPRQRWIFFHMQPPHHTGPLYAYANVFNWTMSYRSDSDIYLPYGTVWPLWHRMFLQKDTRLTEQISDLTMFRSQRRKAKNYANAISFDYDSFIRQKTNSVAWCTSKCVTTSSREKYVEQLKQFINVDSYGRCGNMSGTCSKIPHNSYKFYLAFEKSVCADYVTEKFYKALANGVVPVVFRGKAYSQIAPANSYIDADSFATPEELANYLNSLMVNDTLYKEYLTWNDNYEVKLNNKACLLCERLHSFDRGSFTYTDIHDWWFNKGNCEFRD